MSNDHSPWVTNLQKYIYQFETQIFNACNPLPNPCNCMVKEHLPNSRAEGLCVLLPFFSVRYLYIHVLGLRQMFGYFNILSVTFPFIH